jgi:hypothetical protein
MLYLNGLVPLEHWKAPYLKYWDVETGDMTEECSSNDGDGEGKMAR